MNAWAVFVYTHPFAAAMITTSPATGLVGLCIVGLLIDAMNAKFLRAVEIYIVAITITEKK